MLRARPIETLIAALAVVVASWPLTTLVQQVQWLMPAVAFIAAVALAGMLGRYLLAPGWVTLLGQLVLSLVLLIAFYLNDHLWFGLPTPATAGELADRVRDTVRIATTYAAPAPGTKGVLLVIIAGMTLAAVAVDYVGLTRGSPALAGLALLGEFLVSASNSGAALPPYYFLALAFMWLLMLARDGSGILRRWSSVQSTPQTPVVSETGERTVAGYATVARSVGFVALLVALVLPAVVPHLPPRYLANGLGRNSEAVGSSSVAFGDSVDLLADLGDRSNRAILAYSTDDLDPQPLRVTVLTNFVDGQWQTVDANSLGVAKREHNGAKATLDGLDRDVPRTVYTDRITGNILRAPEVATPVPISAASFPGTSWGLDDPTNITVVSHTPTSYTVSYEHVAPDGIVPKLPPQTDQGIPQSAFDARTVDPASEGLVSKLTEQVTRGDKSSLQQAEDIQNYLRGSRFTYSLRLAPQQIGTNGTPLDPISNFLVTRRGYCVQFATAMVMMARSAGIPARMAEGFLPGTPNDQNVYTVVAADAHAWPELWITGLGWTRFEPTPAVQSGAAPQLSTAAPGTIVGGGRPLDTDHGGPAAGRPVRTNTNPNAPLGVLPTTATPSREFHIPLQWPIVLGVLVLLLLALLVLPLSAALHRRGRKRRARTPAARVEAEWSTMLSRLADLGIATPTGRTPRQLRAYYAREALLDRTALPALDRAAAGLERSRYAAPRAGGSDISADTHQVVSAVRRTRRRRTRLRAMLIPGDGTAALRSRLARIGDLLQRPGGWVQRRRPSLGS